MRVVQAWSLQTGLLFICGLPLAGCPSAVGEGLKSQANAAAKAAGDKALADAKGQLRQQAEAVGGELLASASDVVIDATVSAAVGASQPTAVAASKQVALVASAGGAPKAGGAACVPASEAVPDREIAELARSLLARSAAHAVASAKLCEYRARRTAAEETIRHERAARKYSGVLNTDRLHAAGLTMAEMDTSTERLERRIEQLFKQPALACAGGLAVVSSCMAEVGSCRSEVEDVRGAWPLVESFMLGVVVTSRENQLKAQLGTTYSSVARARADAAASLLGQSAGGDVNPYD